MFRTQEQGLRPGDKIPTGNGPVYRDLSARLSNSGLVMRPEFLKPAFEAKLVKPGKTLIGKDLVEAVLIGGYGVAAPQASGKPGASGDDFKLGLVLYDGERGVPFGNRLFAAPLSCLWG